MPLRLANVLVYMYRLGYSETARRILRPETGTAMHVPLRIAWHFLL